VTTTPKKPQQPSSSNLTPNDSAQTIPKNRSD
jgi:hypothetical protein